jgi:hypothetical protein
MKSLQTSMLLSLLVSSAVLAALSVGTAIGQTSPRSAVVRAQNAGSAPKVISRTRQPTGKLKASSFAPRPTKRRVFGAPIQPPIVRNQPPKKPK